MEFGRPLKAIVEAHTGDNKPTYGSAYTFRYWYLESGDTGTEPPAVSENDTMPDHSETVYAYRTGNPEDFRVLFWLQNADDDGYTLAKYKDVHTAKNSSGGYVDGAFAGSFISVAQDSDSEWVSLTWKNNTQPYTHPKVYNLTGQITEAVVVGDGTRTIDAIDYYHLNWEKTMEENNNGSVEVKANGTTTINVYYDRNTYTLWFFLGKSIPGNGSSVDFDMVTLSEIPDGEKVYYKSGEDYIELKKYTDANDSFYGYPATNETENVYGLVNGVWVPLDATTTTGSTFTPKFTYQLANGNSGTQYGIVDGEYVELRSETGYIYTVYTTTDGRGQSNDQGANGVTYYYNNGGEYSRAYYFYGAWRERNNRYGTTIKNQNIYSRSTGLVWTYYAYTLYTGTSTGTYYIPNEDGTYTEHRNLQWDRNRREWYTVGGCE